MRVCPVCAKYGTPVKEAPVASGSSSGSRMHGSHAPARHVRMSRKDTEMLESTEVLVEDYSERIRKAREHMSLTQEELAKKILEKRTVIAKLERSEMHPDNKLIKKLEKALDIKLTEKVYDSEVKTSTKASGLTLGDLLKDKIK